MRVREQLGGREEEISSYSRSLHSVYKHTYSPASMRRVHTFGTAGNGKGHWKGERGQLPESYLSHADVKTRERPNL